MNIFDMILLGLTTKYSEINKADIHPDVKLAIPQGTSMASAAAAAQRRMAGYDKVIIADGSGSMYTPIREAESYWNPEFYT